MIVVCKNCKKKNRIEESNINKINKCANCHEVLDLSRYLLRRSKSELKKELKIYLSKARITIDDLKQVEEKERKEFIETKVLEVNFESLQWAKKNNIIQKDELDNDPFFTENEKLNEIIVNGGLAAAGVAGSGALLAQATAPVFLGLGGGFGAIGLSAAATIAAPIVGAVAIGYGINKYKENEKLKKFVEHFDKEKEKIFNFYSNKIDSLIFVER